MSEMFKDCWIPADHYGGDGRPYFSMKEAATVLESLGFTVERPKRVGAAYGIQLGPWRIWKCISGGGLAWATAQVVDGRIQDRQWFNYTDSGDGALEQAVNRVLGEVNANA